MTQRFISVPFKIKDEHGISHIEGLAKFSQFGVIFEFEKKFLGFIETGVKEFGLSLTEIESVEFKKGVFKLSAKIEIFINNFAKLNSFPNNKGRIRLGIRRADFERAEIAVDTLAKSLHENRLLLPSEFRPLFDDSETETKELQPKET